MLGLLLQRRLQKIWQNLVVRYNPGWCRFGVVHVQYACTGTTTQHHISCMCHPRVWSLALIQYLVILWKKASKRKAASWKWSLYAPLISFICMIIVHFIRIYHQQASEWYCFLSLAHAPAYSEWDGSSDYSGPYEFKLTFIHLNQFKPLAGINSV